MNNTWYGIQHNNSAMIVKLIMFIDLFLRLQIVVCLYWANQCLLLIINKSFTIMLCRSVMTTNLLGYQIAKKKKEPLMMQ